MRFPFRVMLLVSFSVLATQAACLWCPMNIGAPMAQAAELCPQTVVPVSSPCPLTHAFSESEFSSFSLPNLSPVVFLPLLPPPLSTFFPVEIFPDAFHHHDLIRGPTQSEKLLRAIFKRE
ncbi:MAG TPA: hypothetical protein VJB99_02165 [Patescibacteria group bacterium]|nr:hypothetical protein [Patescibacteria group bacterium]